MNDFTIINKYVKSPEINVVANALLLAQRIKEESWNGKRYLKSDLDSAEKSCMLAGLEPFWIKIITNWLSNYWNDSQEWAMSIVTK